MSIKNYETMLSSELHQKSECYLSHLYSTNLQYNTYGQLTMIIGPMFSGKTSSLIDIYNKIQMYPNSIKMWKFNYTPSILVLNYKLDTRYSDDKLSSHDKKMIPCVFIDNLSEIADIVNQNELSQNIEPFIESDFILINEGQFFSDIVEWVDIAVNKYKKNIIICGLDGDFKRKSFGNWLNLIPQSDSIIKLHASCKYCNNNAIFTHRLTSEKEQTVIGSDNYVPLCRMCFNNSVKN